VCVPDVGQHAPVGARRIARHHRRCHHPPARFDAHLRRALEITRALRDDQQALVIKLWNELAVGNYFEPDALTGHARVRHGHANFVGSLPEGEFSDLCKARRG